MESHPAIEATLDPGRARPDRAPPAQGEREKNLSLAELSRRTGVSKSTLPRLETGHRKPSLELLLPIAAALAVPIDEIVAAPASSTRACRRNRCGHGAASSFRCRGREASPRRTN
ncbi:helix-turn-helix domain-containing protein [Actinomadura sp. LOL_016]|uniref:helix-turn-helix domain-containing protein n=1 Tax=unclassified Actinomadura TaxID=2626254 RepID=UPI003A809DD6